MTIPGGPGSEADTDVEDCYDHLFDAVDALREEMMGIGIPPFVIAALDRYRTRVTGSPRRHANLTRSDSISLAGRSVERLRNSLKDYRDPLGADITDALATFGDRIGRIVSARIGVRGSIITLEDLGVEEGVTRERVRQIVQQFTRRSAGWCPNLLTLDLLQLAINNGGGVLSLYELRTAVEPLLRLTTRDIDTISSLLASGWLTGLRASKFRGVWVANDAYAEQLEVTIARIRRRSRRSLNRWGAVELADMSALAGNDGPGLMVGLMFGGGSSTGIGWMARGDRA